MCLAYMVMCMHTLQAVVLLCMYSTVKSRASQVAQMVKNPPTVQETSGSIPGLGRSLGEGHGNPLQYSCLENPMDRGAW